QDRGFMSYLDLADPDHPKNATISFSQSPGAIVAVSGTRMYYMTTANPANGTVFRLEVYDITDPYHPALLGASETLPWSYPTAHFGVMGNLLVWNSLQRGPTILDTSDPAHIQQVDPASYSVAAELGQPFGKPMAVAGDYAYQFQTGSFGL